ncbi:MAG: SEL1-like repeat protein [Alphaproteobacteria bacterium]|nr:SEL1-like repeat protein [Alphaproteobacteria bacterium]
MGQELPNDEQTTYNLLLETARALVLRGDNKFSIATLCAESGVERAQFRAHFSGKTALMAALMQDRPAPNIVPEPAPAEAPTPTPKAEVTSESAVSTPDAWLERRLRVFERALNALETKAEATAQQQARAIALLEERLTGVPQAVTEKPGAPLEAPVAIVAAPAARQEAQPEPDAEKKPVPELLAIAPLPVSGISREEMADVLQSAREAARAASAVIAEAPSLDKNLRARWLAIGALSLVALFLCIGLTLGDPAGASQMRGDGISHRRAAPGALARTVALADFGDSKAQAKLGLAYLRGQGVTSDPSAALRWSAAAAKAGEPVAQYLMGALYQQGDKFKADPALAFAWFASAAAKGNLKAMHNLAIAYAQGLGTDKDERKAAEWFTRAAERGYVDSQFDLAVLYERGTGVKEDLKQALKWYAIAALSGDAPSKERAEVLRGQLNASDVKLAANAALGFAPLPALGAANSL